MVSRCVLEACCGCKLSFYNRGFVKTLRSDTERCKYFQYSLSRLDGNDSSRGIHTSQRMFLEPSTQKKPDVAEAGLKHKLVVCERGFTCIPARKPVSWPQPRVVIVGGGLAGLSAARILVQAGVQDVVVLEALSRPGGRVHTCLMNSTKVDLGATALYGSGISNMAYNLATMEKLIEGQHELMYPSGPFFTSDGILLYDIERPSQIFFQAINETTRLFHSKKKSKMSVEDFIKPKLKKALKSCCALDRSEEMELILAGLENETKLRLGDDLSNLSADYLGSYTDIPSGIIPLKGKGASVLLGPLLADVGSKVKYNKPVQSIRWGTRLLEMSKRGSVLCCDGEEIPCDFIICTVSLGVLKSQSETLFSPPLPKEKLNAISNLSFGTVNHIYLEYDKPFWAPGEGMFSLGWTKEELEHREAWVKGIGRIEEVSNNVLMVALAGREAIWTESCPDKSIAEEFTMFLRKMLGDPSLPCPKHIVRSRWSSDIHFKGSFSYLGLQSSVDDQCALMVPVPDAPSLVPPVLLFAGEATVPGRFSTMDGAMLSGYREAERIIEICNKHNGPPKAQKPNKKKPECLPRSDQETFNLGIPPRRPCF